MIMLVFDKHLGVEFHTFRWGNVLNTISLLMLKPRVRLQDCENEHLLDAGSWFSIEYHAFPLLPS